MGCDHPSFVPVGPLVGELWHCQYFPTWRPADILNFKIFNTWSRDCHCGPNLLQCVRFYQNWFTRLASRRAHNCRMFNAPLLGNGCCHGNRIMVDMSRARWNATTQVSSQSVHWLASYGISNIFQHSSCRHFELKKNNIWSRDCHCGPNLLLCTKFHQNWFTRSTSRRP